MIPRRVRVGVTGYALAAALGLAGAIFLTFATYLGLRQALEPWLAALLTGIVLLLLALVVIWVTRSRVRSPGLARRQHEAAGLDDVEGALRESIDDLVSAGIRRHPVAAAVSTLLLGIAAGYGRSASRDRAAETRRRSR